MFPHIAQSDHAERAPRSFPTEYTVTEQEK